jgi:serine/threonine protein kinase
MELLTGEDLRACLRREGRLSVPSALRIVNQVLRALLRAHAAGIVHRDLKPDNVFLCARDDDPSFVKLVDFGISKVARARSADTLTRRGTVLGTAFYMSPEQAQSFADIDGRTDLFSLGAIAFEMLTGRPPHGGRTYEAVLIAICTQDAPDVRTLAPEVPGTVAAIVSRALERERERRFQSAAEFLAAITKLEVEGAFAPGATLVATPRSDRDSHSVVKQGARRKRYGTLVAGIVATLAGFALTAYFVARGGAPSSVSKEAPPVVGATLNALSPSASVGVASSAIRVEPAAPTAASSAPKPHRPPAAKPTAREHVGTGLQLSTKEP